MQSHNLSTVREVVQLWERQWDEHLAAVQEHFKDRSDTLLVLNITDPNAGEQLAGFVQRCFLGRFDPSRFLHYHGTAPNILEGRCQHEPSEDVCYKAGSIPVGRRVSQRKEKRNKRHHPHLSRWANNQHGRKNHRKKKPNWMIIKGSQDRRNLQRLVSKEGEVISIDIGYKVYIIGLSLFMCVCVCACVFCVCVCAYFVCVQLSHYRSHISILSSRDLSELRAYMKKDHHNISSMVQRCAAKGSCRFYRKLRFVSASSTHLFTPFLKK